MVLIKKNYYLIPHSSYLIPISYLVSKLSQMQDLIAALQMMRKHFDTGTLIPYEYRKQQLIKLKQSVLKNEKEISEALYTDMKKSAEEAYATETGLLLAELNTSIKNLYSWMKPKSVSTNLVNLPSTSKIYRDPLGVVLIIAPWNYPLQLSLVPLVGAIAGGNCVVVKPSELAPATALIIDKIIGETFSPEYVKVVLGDGAEIIPAMIKGFRFDHIFYTGSIPVGKSIYQMAAADLVPVTLELGGKSPVIIEKDANIEVACRRIALAKFVNAGQTCIAPDYVLVQNEVKEKFISLLKNTISKFFTQDASGSYDYSKIINTKRFDKVVGYLKEGKIVYGGQYNREMLFIAPTIIEDVSLEGTVMNEEIFGPVLPVLGYDSHEEAIAIVHRNPNPLAFYLFTDSSSIEKEWITKLSFGGGCINNSIWHFANHHLPFGGVGSSGMGAYHGKFTFETFTRPKSVMKTPAWFDPGIKYPSFKGRMKLFKMLFK
jgi:aldehyde dehydrogenase (NAD+)